MCNNVKIVLNCFTSIVGNMPECRSVNIISDMLLNRNIHSEFQYQINNSQKVAAVQELYYFY